MQRRRAVQLLGGLGGAALAGGMVGCSSVGGWARPQVVVVGGGFGGAAAAKYLRLASKGQVDVTLIEPNAAFVSCPMSNLVLGGSLQMAHITRSYATLERNHGVRWLRSTALQIDPAQQQVLLDDGRRLHYQRLVLSPGIDMMWEKLAGLQDLASQQQVLHAWKAGAQTVALRQQLQAMPEGGVFVISVPLLPFRCPPAPYERACQVAAYFRQHKPNAKILILDANDDVAAEGALFRQAWRERYAGMIEYRPKFQVAEVDLASRMLVSEFGDKVQWDVLNLIPEQRAGRIAQQSGLANINARWCEVDFLSYASKSQPLIHVLGDAIQIAPKMPKAGQMAAQQGRVCAQAIVAMLAGHDPDPAPQLASACYSFVAPDAAIHLGSVHGWDAAQKTMLPLAAHATLSAQASALEAQHGHAWAQAIWREVLE